MNLAIRKQPTANISRLLKINIFMRQDELDFNWFREMDEIGVHFVSREKSSLRCKVVKSVPTDDLGDGIVSDEIVTLTDLHTRKKYTKAFRRIRAIVEVDGVSREMVFVTNNFTWSARTIADLYKSRWTIELLFKELK